MGTDETINKNPPFDIKPILSKPSLYFLPFLKSKDDINIFSVVPMDDKNISDIKVAYVPFWFNRLIIPSRKLS